MRTFVVIGHKAVTDDGFTLDDLCGSTGRLDVLIRAVNSAIMLSHGVRRDTDIRLVLLGKPDPPRTIRISGETVKYLNPDERSTGALLKQALSKAHFVPEDGGELESTPGITISRAGLGENLSSLSSTTTPRPVILLDQSGQDIRSAEIPCDTIFVLSDHMAFSQEDMQALGGYSPATISLGPTVVHTHHAITLAHNEMDRRGM